MTRKRKLIVGLGIAAVAILAAAILIRLAPVQDWILSKVAERTAAQPVQDFSADDRLQVVFCGTQPPPPHPHRAKSCTAVIAGGRAFIVDTGPGSANNLALWRFPLDRIAGILITHFHSDHIGGLGEFRMQSWAYGRDRPLPVYGPDGVEDVVAGTNRMYRFDDAYRSEVHGFDRDAARLVARPFGMTSEEERRSHMADAVIYDRDGLRITAFQVNHEPVYPAVGYRFDYRGRSVVISGDTARSANLVRMSKGADVLIHEGHNPVAHRIVVDALNKGGSRRLADVMSDTDAYHASPVEVVREANEAGVELLVFNHLGPFPPDDFISSSMFGRGLAAIRDRADWMFADDGLVLTLPEGSDAIEQSRMD